MASVMEPSSQGSSQEGEKQQGPRAGERSKLVQRLLDGGTDLPAFLKDLLATMAVTVAGTEAAGFVIERSNDQFVLNNLGLHIRQDESDAQTRAAALEAFQNLVKPCIIQGKDGAIDLGNATGMEPEPQYCLITLLRDGPDIVAVAAVITRCLNLERARQRLLSMQLVAGYFEFFTLKRSSEANKVMAQNHQSVLQLSRAVADAEGFLSAAMNLCNELANATGATRVSIGWLKGRLIRVKALSHTEEFDKKQELIVQLEKTMEECYDQENMVLYDPTGLNKSDAVTRQAAILSRAQGGHVVLSLPLRRHAEIEGVVTLEFLSGDIINQRMIESLTISVDLLAPQLYDRHENDHWLFVKVGLSAKRTAEEFLGPKHWVAKLVTTGVILLLLVLFNFFNIPTLSPLLSWADVRWTYKVTAPITFEAVQKQSMCAPFDGQIDSVGQLIKLDKDHNPILDEHGQVIPILDSTGHPIPVAPGIAIPQGTPLFSLKTYDLVKQLAKSNADAESHKAKAQGYSADNTKIADQLAEEAQEHEAEAESLLLESQIARATVRAPFDGQILKWNDLDQKKDAPVKEGEEQMVFAQPNNLWVVLSVPERDIQDVSKGSTGWLATTSKPTEKVKFTVDRIVPQGQPKEGSNVFTVYGTPDQVIPSWRPGMAGEARVDVGKRTIAWLWSHRLMEFIRLKMWM